MSDINEKEPIEPSLQPDDRSPPNEKRAKVASLEEHKNKAQHTKDLRRRISLTPEHVAQLTTPQKQALLLRAVLSDDTTDSELARMLVALYP